MQTWLVNPQASPLMNENVESARKSALQHVRKKVANHRVSPLMKVTTEIWKKKNIHTRRKTKSLKKRTLQMTEWKSTSGGMLWKFGDHPFVPISWACNRQDGSVTEQHRSWGNIIETLVWEWKGYLYQLCLILRLTRWSLMLSEQRENPSIDSNTKPQTYTRIHWPCSPNAPDSSGRDRVFFLDNKALANIIIKGISPLTRHLSVRYVHINQQIAYILTKGSFTRDKWNESMILFGMVSESFHRSSSSVVATAAPSEKKKPLFDERSLESQRRVVEIKPKRDWAFALAENATSEKAHHLSRPKKGRSPMSWARNPGGKETVASGRNEDHWMPARQQTTSSSAGRHKIPVSMHQENGCASCKKKRKTHTKTADPKSPFESEPTDERGRESQKDFRKFDLTNLPMSTAKMYFRMWLHVRIIPNELARWDFYQRLSKQSLIKHAGNSEHLACKSNFRRRSDWRVENLFVVSKADGERADNQSTCLHVYSDPVFCIGPGATDEKRDPVIWKKNAEDGINSNSCMNKSHFEIEWHMFLGCISVQALRKLTVFMLDAWHESGSFSRRELFSRACSRTSRIGKAKSTNNFSLKRKK